LISEIRVYLPGVNAVHSREVCARGFRKSNIVMNTILILHGWGIGSKTWVKVKEILESRGYKVYVPDLPGFGDSPVPEKPWSINDYADWALSYCKKNNLLQFVLIGHSFGGGISVKLVNNFPEKVRGLVLVAPKLHRQKTLRYYGGLALAKIGKLVFSIPILSFFHPLARKILYELIGTKDYYKLELDKTNTMKETFRRVVGADLIPELAAIRIPTLIIWGDKDRMTPISDAYLIQKGINGSKLEIIENGRHALNLETPEILAEKIIKFIGIN